jgi:deoxycytidylate deaminase
MRDSRNARRGAKKILNNDDNYKCVGALTSKYFECFDNICVKISTDKQKMFLDIAAKIALKSPMGHKHGAIVVHKGKIIGAGHNYYVTQSFSIHAEVAALSCIKSKDKHLLPYCDLYVVRIGPNRFDNPLKYSKPCCNCQHTILKNNIKRTFYSTNYSYDKIINFAH